MPVSTRPQKNIWVAAGDGDLARVQELVEDQSISPDAPDPYTYTPMHAAASYAQLQVLDYLILKGGNVNVMDGDGDTPLYTVENLETARYLVEHGATVNTRNNDGISPTEHLSEDFPEIASYLATVLSTAPPAIPGVPSQELPSQLQQDAASEQLTSSLMQSVQEIMERAEAEGRDPEEELRQAVGRTVVQGMISGYGMANDAGDAARRDVLGDEDPTKRRRLDQP